MAYWISRRAEGQVFPILPAVGGVGVGGCAVRERLRCMHGHVIFQHSTAGHVTVPVSTGGY